MRRFPKPQKTWQLIVLVLAVIATVVARMNRGAASGPEAKRRSPSESAEVRKAPRTAAGKWERLDGCTLVDDRNNDGDSFVLRHGGEDFTFRLYFADCPEKRRHQFNGDRIAQQGRYFGNLSEGATIATGEEARDFALEILRNSPVTVETRWEEVFDSERHYAFVTAGGTDLAEALVSRGLARIHTKGASRPGGPSERDQKKRLHELGSMARAKRLGAWGKK